MQETYTLTQAMRLAGISPGNLANWRRRYPELEENGYITPPRGKKRSATLDLTGAIYLAICGRLNKHGLDPVDAAKCADRFTEILRMQHWESVHEIFERKVLLFIDINADNSTQGRILAMPRASTYALKEPPIQQAVSFDFGKYPSFIKIVVDLNAIYEEAATLTRGK